MQEQYFKNYSPILNRDMEHALIGHGGKLCLAFVEHALIGHGGKLCLAFAPQNGHTWDFRNFGMVETVRPWIEAGKLRILLVDSIYSANTGLTLQFFQESFNKYTFIRTFTYTST